MSQAAGTFYSFIFIYFILLMFILGTQHVKMAIAAVAATGSRRGQQVQ
jgi:hypothetical protein